MASETCSAGAKRRLPGGEWKSFEIGSQFISFIQVHDWLIAVKFQRWLEEAINSAAKVCNKVRIKSSRLAWFVSDVAFDYSTFNHLRRLESVNTCIWIRRQRENWMDFTATKVISSWVVILEKLWFLWAFWTCNLFYTSYVSKLTSKIRRRNSSSFICFFSP